MKLTLEHRSHKSSPSFTTLLQKSIGSLHRILRIDEARIVIERRTESSPPFRLAAHLVTPGPDVKAEAVDHTLHAALSKLLAHLKGAIGHRRQKQARRIQPPNRHLAPRHAAAS